MPYFILFLLFVLDMCVLSCTELRFHLPIMSERHVRYSTGITYRRCAGRGPGGRKPKPDRDYRCGIVLLAQTGHEVKWSEDVQRQGNGRILLFSYTPCDFLST